MRGNPEAGGPEPSDAAARRAKRGGEASAKGERALGPTTGAARESVPAAGAPAPASGAATAAEEGRGASSPVQGTPRRRDGVALGFLEAVLLAASLPAVGWVVHAEDPFFLGHAFSWLVLPPLLAALRHGFAAGCVGAAAVAVPLILHWRMQGPGQGAFPGEAMLGMFVATMVAGQTSDVWSRKRRELESLLASAGRRANQFAQAYVLTRLSHDRLKEQHPTVPNLRDAVDRLTAVLPAGELGWSQLGAPLLATLAQFCGLEAATLVEIAPDGRGASGVRAGKTRELEVVPLASHGAPPPVSSDDPLLRDAHATGRLTCVDRRRPSDSGEGELLAVLPAADATGTPRAFLCIRAMPFFAFHRANLEAIAILLAHAADRLGPEGARSDAEEASPRLFDERLADALAAARGGTSPLMAVLAFRPESPLRGLASPLLAALVGPEDSVCRRRLPSGREVLCLLVPRPDKELGALRARLDEVVQHELGRSFSEAGGLVDARVLRESSEAEALLAAFDREGELARVVR